MKKLVVMMAVLIALTTGCSKNGEDTSPTSEKTSEDIVTLETYVEVANEVNELREQFNELLMLADELKTSNNQIKDENVIIKEQLDKASEHLTYLVAASVEVDDYVELQNGLTDLQIQMNLMAEDLETAIETDVVEIQQKVLYVDNALDLLNTIESNRHIILTEGDYNLSTVDLSQVISEHMYVTEVYDGLQLEFIGLRNLTIEGAGVDETVLLVEPRYAYVLTFNNSSALSFINLTMGHTIEKGSCVGGVISFSDSRDMTFQNTRLYGCGTYGIVADGLFGLDFLASTIDGCSYGIMQFHNSKDLLFEASVFKDNETYDLITFGSTQNVMIKDCVFENNYTDYEAMFIAPASRSILVEASLFKGNTAPSLTTEYSNIQFVDNIIEEGQFGAAKSEK